MLPQNLYYLDHTGSQINIQINPDVVKVEVTDPLAGCCSFKARKRKVPIDCL
jgi:hypothetical protein